MKGHNLKNMKMTNAMRMKLFCLATSAMAMTATHLTGQVFTTLHSFPACSGDTYANVGGAFPTGELILSSNTLYGTTQCSGSSDNGTVFSMNTDGTGFTTLHAFHGLNDGSDPLDGVLLSGDTLYGPANMGGSPDYYGTVFTIKTNGTGFKTLHTFDGLNDEAYPYGGLMLLGNTLYGTSMGVDSGTVFAMNTNGTGFTTLYIFTALAGSDSTNSDGAWPCGALVLSGNTLYGTASVGGQYGAGTLFAVNTDGTGFTTLHAFKATGADSSGFYTNSDGACPYGALVLSGNTLYGSAYSGCSSGNGTVFAVNTDGTGFTNLHCFTASRTNSSGFCTNSDGASLFGTLMLSGNTLYGVAQSGGSSGNGTVFSVNTDGTAFTTLYSFTALAGSNSTNSDGACPASNLILSGNTLYGTTYEGGMWGSGTVFSLSFLPQPSVIPSGGNVILTWPTNYAGFDYSGFTVQSTTNLGSSAVWTTNSPVPVVVDGQKRVTNPISASQQFFRLSQ
jgi:uncharacterized repeat protein (TIGR03803 family)